jgi:hypothetical protein
MRMIVILVLNKCNTMLVISTSTYIGSCVMVKVLLTSQYSIPYNFMVKLCRVLMTIVLIKQSTCEDDVNTDLFMNRTHRCFHLYLSRNDSFTLFFLDWETLSQLSMITFNLCIDWKSISMKMKYSTSELHERHCNTLPMNYESCTSSRSMRAKRVPRFVVFLSMFRHISLFVVQHREHEHTRLTTMIFMQSLDIFFFL